MDIKIRRANIEDIEWMLSELKIFSKFIDMKRDMYGDDEFCRAGLSGLIQNQVVFLAVRSVANIETRLGFIAGFQTPHLFRPDIRVLCELFWWVAEAHRNSRAGSMLLNEFVEYGEKNADLITFALEAQSPVNEKTLLKRGFVYRERNFTKEIL